MSTNERRRRRLHKNWGGGGKSGYVSTAPPINSYWNILNASQRGTSARATLRTVHRHRYAGGSAACSAKVAQCDCVTSEGGGFEDRPTSQRSPWQQHVDTGCSCVRVRCASLAICRVHAGLSGACRARVGQCRVRVGACRLLSVAVGRVSSASRCQACRAWEIAECSTEWSDL